MSVSLTLPDLVSQRPKSLFVNNEQVYQEMNYFFALVIYYNIFKSKIHNNIDI